MFNAVMFSSLLIKRNISWLVSLYFVGLPLFPKFNSATFILHCLIFSKFFQSFLKIIFGLLNHLVWAENIISDDVQQNNKNGSPQSVLLAESHYWLLRFSNKPKMFNMLEDKHEQPPSEKYGYMHFHFATKNQLHLCSILRVKDIFITDWSLFFYNMHISINDNSIPIYTFNFICRKKKTTCFLITIFFFDSHHIKIKIKICRQIWSYSNIYFYFKQCVCPLHSYF